MDELPGGTQDAMNVVEEEASDLTLIQRLQMDWEDTVGEVSSYVCVCCVMVDACVSPRWSQ